MPPKPDKPVRTPVQSRSKATVAAILEAAAQILRTERLEGTTTSRIAKRAGVSVGSLYQYFKDKDAIFGALVDNHLAALTELRVRQYASLEDGEVQDVIPRLVDLLLEMHEVDPALRWELHRWEASHGLERIEAFRDGNTDTIAALLQYFGHRLRPIEDPALTARVIVIAFGSVVERMYRESPQEPVTPALRRELSALMVGFVAPSNPMFGAPEDGTAPSDPTTHPMSSVPS